MSDFKGVFVIACLLLSGLSWAADQARIAIVIDDMGYQPGLDRAVLALDYRVAVAVIPEAPEASEVATLAGRQQRDVLIHLPLAGLGHDNCQPVLTCMGMEWSAVQMHNHLAAAMQRVHGAVGINNHQGSRFTENEQAVRNLVAGIDSLGRELGRPLFVLDSRTSPITLLEQKALKAGLAAARRHVFLDHSNDPADIQKAWDDLIALARSNGTAIAIGHPRVNTVRFLEQAVPALAGMGIELVPVSKVARHDSSRTRNDSDSYSAAP